MKLLFDQNLSPKLVGRLNELFPGSEHVLSVLLDTATDDEIWEYAKLNDMAVVTKDEDFDNLRVLRGTPPKIIWLQLGNCTTTEVEVAFRDHFAEITAFEKDNSAGTIVLN